ncbi:hypothetical protein, conserved [Eimeria praecox]|uniref:Uncharacterized protein n=1 Tax=Eimeria praecox TaxID=51316 RepID=U6GVH7_9EIME|nr:hypothetical protein, conserved [Eimeria praecox]
MDENNSFSEVAALSKSWASGVHTPQEEEGDTAAGPLAQRLQQQLAEAKQQLAEARQQLATSETERETLQDRLKNTERERDKEKDKRMTLEIQVEKKRNNLVNEFMSQTDELEKTIARLKAELEESLEKLVDASSDSGESAALKKSIELYKEKAADLEEKLVEAKSLGDLLQSQKDELEAKILAAEKKAEEAQLALAEKDAEMEAKTFEVEALQEELDKAR